MTSFAKSNPDLSYEDMQVIQQQQKQLNTCTVIYPVFAVQAFEFEYAVYVHVHVRQVSILRNGDSARGYKSEILKAAFKQRNSNLPEHSIDKRSTCVREVRNCAARRQYSLPKPRLLKDKNTGFII